MKQCGRDWTKRGIKLECTDQLEDKGLWELVDSSFTCALLSIHVDVDFLFNTDPEMWTDNPTFQKLKTYINSLKVVNDAAERSISLMSGFNESITKNEVQMQRLIQVVEDHRKRVYDSCKRTLKTTYLVVSHAVTNGQTVEYDFS
jgi:hypothetical protein